LSPTEKLRLKFCLAGTVFYSLAAIPLIFIPSISANVVHLFGHSFSPIIAWLALYIISGLTVGAWKMKYVPFGRIEISQDDYAKLPEAKLSTEFPKVDAEL
jgi:hypothetical protein